MGKRIDLNGRRFGRLTIIADAKVKRGGHTAWQCQCDCGNNTIVRGDSLMSGKTQSCGCQRLEAITSHGMKHSSTYRSWSDMKSRCNDPNTLDYKRYGGRGIKVCDRWNAFQLFYADMGEKPKGLSLERIDNNKGYSPDNCKWATRKEQSRNQRPNRMITYFGETKCLAEWAESLGINGTTLHCRL